MSYGFIKTMRNNPNQSYIQVTLNIPPSLLGYLVNAVKVLQNTRHTLAEHYQQIPQLSVGGLYDLDQRVSVSSMTGASLWNKSI